MDSGCLFKLDLLQIAVEVVRVIEGPNWLQFEAELASPSAFSHILSCSEQAQKQWMPSQHGSGPGPVVEYLWQIAELWYGPMLLEEWESSREVLDFQHLWVVTLSAFVYSNLYSFLSFLPFFRTCCALQQTHLKVLWGWINLSSISCMPWKKECPALESYTA